MKNVAFVFIVAIIGCFANFAFAQSDTQEAFQSGNEAYQAENYEQALDHYLSAASESRSFELYFNLGNTYFKLDSLGKSILYYERAREMKPRNEDIVVNLQIARQQLVDRIEPLPSLGVNSFWERITAESKLTTYSWLTIIGLFASAAIYLLMLVFRKREQLKSSLRIVFIIAIIFSVGCFFLAFQTNNSANSQKSAVIMSKATDVTVTPEKSGKVLFKLHEGTKVEITERSGEWVKVQLANGSTGWLKKSDLETV